MSEWRTFKKLLKSPKSDVIVMVCTFGLTVIIDLTVAYTSRRSIVSRVLFEEHVGRHTSNPSPRHYDNKSTTRTSSSLMCVMSLSRPT